MVEEENPCIDICFSSDNEIDACLRLPAVATVGPPNHEVPPIEPGIMLPRVHNTQLLCYAHYYAIDAGYIYL